MRAARLTSKRSTQSLGYGSLGYLQGSGAYLRHAGWKARLEAGALSSIILHSPSLIPHLDPPWINIGP